MDSFVNSVGMTMCAVPPGSFTRGCNGGFWEERPAHEVTITMPYFAASTPVTNAQYELFDPQHKWKRRHSPFCHGDNDPVIFVNFEEAAAYCRWLSIKEGRPYRLPTEAEWEWAMRGGATTDFLTGDALPEAYHRNQRETWYPAPTNCWGEEEDTAIYGVDLRVGQTPQNKYGIRDVHGIVEQWCNDVHAPYPKGPSTDPRCASGGEFMVTRGGSHNTNEQYLRFGARMAALPETAHWFIGFRVFLGEPNHREYSHTADPNWARDVKPTPRAASFLPKDGPQFAGPLRYVHVTPSENGPHFAHNHVPAVCECPNGDLLAVWYSTALEWGREMLLLASRLKAGETQWTTPDVFWNPPGRNASGTALVVKDGVIHHFNGMGVADTWGSLALVHRVSSDNGVTWSRTNIVNPRYGLRTMPIASPFVAKDGHIYVPCDAVAGENGGTCLYASTDGKTFLDPGGTAKGIHGAVIELTDGRLLALGRGDNINGCMPLSISHDGGRTWKARQSPFPAISNGQRPSILRLQQGPLLFFSFTQLFPLGGGSGLYAATSEDEGETWVYRRLITPDSVSGESFDGGAWTGEFVPGKTTAEPKGYLTSLQSRDGTIHVFSSALTYRFNYEWLMERN